MLVILTVIGIFLVLWIFATFIANDHEKSEKERLNKSFYEASTKAAKYINYDERKGCLTISNKKCILIYYKNGIEINDISDINIKKITRTLDLRPEMRTVIFQSVCKIFCEDTNYEQLHDIITSYCMSVEEETKKVPIIKKEIFPKQKPKPKPKSKSKQKTDINSANEDELKALPGISVIYAKKIIKRREEIGGFKDKKEFFGYIKVTDKIRDKLTKLICFNKFKEEKKAQKTKERNIDL